MDDYGTVENTYEDAKMIREELGKNGAIVFPWSHNKIDCYIFFMSITFKKIGVSPFGGNPTGRVYIGLYGKGCGHFVDNKTHPSDWEKLNLDKYGAEAFSDLWNKMWVD